MAISSFWEKQKHYSVWDLMFLACGREPINPRLDVDTSEFPTDVLYAMEWIADAVFATPKYSSFGRNLTKRFVEKHDAVSIVRELGLDASLLGQDILPTPINDSEREKLLKQIGALALLLAEKFNKYKRGENPNALQISQDVELIFDASEFKGKRGAGKSELRGSIAKGVKLLLDE